MKTLILFLALIAPAQADTLILPTVPGTSLQDISQPGIRIEGDTIYQTLPGPMGIINQMGTTYKREGNEYVPHRGILGPQDFSLPSYQVEPGQGGGYIPVPVGRDINRQLQDLLPPVSGSSVRQVQINTNLQLNRLNSNFDDDGSSENE